MLIPSQIKNIYIVQTNGANSVKFNLLLHLCVGWRFFCLPVLEEVRGLERTLPPTNGQVLQVCITFLLQLALRESGT